MASEGDPKIRRVAIVLQSMDADTVRKLLAQFPEGAARAIRRALANLGNVTSAERAAAAQELHRLMGTPNRAPSNDNPAAQFLDQGRRIEDAVQFSPEARERASEEIRLPMPSSDTAGQARTWLDIPPATLAEILQHERPTVVAAILHELPVVMATSVLQLLPISTAAESMAAMPQLHRNDPSVLAELLEQVRAKVDDAVRCQKQNMEGLAKLKAIVAHVPEDQRYLWSTALSNFDPHLPSVLGCTQGDAVDLPAVLAFPRQANSINQSTTERENRFVASAAPEEVPATAVSSDKASPVPVYVSLSDLLNLDDADFVEVLHSVKPATVLLALTGAEPGWLKRVERLMPKKDLPRLRRRVHALSDVTLHEIDNACATILENANSLHAEGRIGSGAVRTLSEAA